MTWGVMVSGTNGGIPAEYLLGRARLNKRVWNVTNGFSSSFDAGKNIER